MKCLKMIFCKKLAGTLSSNGLGSTEKPIWLTAPSSMSLPISSYTGPSALSPKLVTRWLYLLVTLTISSAPYRSP